MKTLEKLRSLNPGLTLRSVLDPEFAPYGRLLSVPDGEALVDALRKTPMPETGNSYTASDPSLEATDAFRAFSRSVFGGMEIQGGFCNGYGHTMNAMEYHKCSEINVTPDGLVLLLALPQDFRDGILESRDVVGFYLPAGVFVEIYPLVLHFAPLAVRKEGFRALVVLEKNTNTPLPSVNTAAPGEERYLWQRNKWLFCHPDSPQAKAGAVIGIRGENIVLNYE